MPNITRPGFMSVPSQAGFVMNPGQRCPLPTVPAEVHRLQSALWAWGVTFQGAQQFATGLPVNNPADRQAIAGMVGQLLKIRAVQWDVIKN